MPVSTEVIILKESFVNAGMGNHGKINRYLKVDLGILDCDTVSFCKWITTYKATWRYNPEDKDRISSPP
jgi:hypothetical protein